MARGVVTAGTTRAKPLRHDIAKVRDVGDFCERAISSCPLLAVGMRARPYTLPWTACCPPRKSSSPTAPATEPTCLLLHLVTPTHRQASARRIPGIRRRMIIGRAVHAPGMASHAHASRAQRLRNLGARYVFAFAARVAEIPQVTNGIAPLHFRVPHEAKATCASQQFHCVGRARLYLGGHVVDSNFVDRANLVCDV
jgi:hypothetical protein